MRLAMQSFGNHEATNLELFETGVAVFTGPNGSGKSMIGEAITWCLWSENIRTSRRGWSPAVPGTVVRLELDGVLYERRKTQSGTKLLIDGKGTTRDNNVVVQNTFGPIRLFLATKVFHRSLLVKFSNATDAERKSLLEFLLGASEFDTWHRDARYELRESKDCLIASMRRLTRYTAELAAWEGELRGLERPKEPVLSKAVKVAKAHFKMKLPGRPTAPNDSVYKNAADKAVRADERVRSGRHQLAKAKKLVAAKTCPTCGSSTDTDRHVGVVDGWIRLVADREDKRDRCDAAVSTAAFTYDQLLLVYNEDCLDFETQVKRRERAKIIVGQYNRDQSIWLRALADYNRRMLYLKVKIRESRGDLSRVRSRILVLETRCRRLTDLCKIYGPRGARVTLLQEAFGVLSDVATQVCRKVYRDPVYVEVQPSESLDTVSLRVRLRSGQDISYRGLSEGERSLIDFSLLKALASIPKATTGAMKLPTIYDDVTDAVDVNNRDRLTRFIQAEADQGTIIVFSHDEETADMFPNAIAYGVSRGVVGRR